MKKLTLVLVLTVLGVILTAGVAFADHARVDSVMGTGAAGDRIADYEVVKAGAYKCNECHGGSSYRTVGPHGGYTSSTRKCVTCHSIHAAQTALLLPGATVTEVCNFCHDLTGTDVAPYYAGDLTNASYYTATNQAGQVKSSHRVFGTTSMGFVYNTTYGSTTIPGGDYTSGGTAVLDTDDQGQLSGTAFTCDSCHTPHALSNKVVDPYFGENHTAVKEDAAAKKSTYYATNRALRSNLNGQAAVTEFGSAWCAACHRGRTNDHAMSSGGDTIYNHPVDETAPGYDFLNLGRNEASVDGGLGDTAQLTTAGVAYYTYSWDGSSNANFEGADPRSNKWWTFAETDPITGDPRVEGYQDAYVWGGAKTGPGCLQCHGNPRDIDAGPYMAAADEDGAGAPSRTTFPHLSTNDALLVSQGDDFCTNCHDSTSLP